jgi:hypothetical protein
MITKELRTRLREAIAAVPGVAGFHGGYVMNRSGLRVRAEKNGGVSFRADLTLDAEHNVAQVGGAVTEAARQCLREAASEDLARADVRFIRLRPRRG